MTDQDFVEKLTYLVGIKSVQELSCEWKVSKPTIQRWLTGKNLPYRLAREFIEKAVRPKLYFDWIWLNVKDGTYTTDGPNEMYGWTERRLVPFVEDCWGMVPNPGF